MLEINARPRVGAPDAARHHAGIEGLHARPRTIETGNLQWMMESGISLVHYGSIRFLTLPGIQACSLLNMTSLQP